MHLLPYLFFNGRCEEAIEFYKEAVGAKVDMLMRFKENPEPPRADCAPIDGNKVMHASLTFGGVTILASDGMTNTQPDFKGFSLSLSVKDQAEAEKTFNALSKGGEIAVPLNRTFFSPCFGMTRDKFGVGWMVMVMP
jgi:PhnB protein